jgi:ABC-type multidrug transport system ATPase subunit
MSMVVQIRSLTKRYIGTSALSDITLEVPEGHILGLLGPNGSGKTTLMKILAGLVSPTSGSVLVDGMVPGVGTKAFVSFLPDVNHLDRWMSVGEAGDFYADFYHDFLSTQMVADVERFFDDVVFLDNGRVVLAGEAENLRTERGASIEDIYKEVYGHVEAR